jgi:hypothetical protein
MRACGLIPLNRGGLPVLSVGVDRAVEAADTKIAVFGVAGADFGPVDAAVRGGMDGWQSTGNKRRAA